jgi:hypothetical protein
LRINVATTGAGEPMWVFMPFLRRHDQASVSCEHPNDIREITKLTLTSPTPFQSPAAQSLTDVLFCQSGPDHLLTIEFDHGLRQEATDFRPDLPLILRR